MYNKKFFTLKILHFENSSKKLRFLRKFFTIVKNYYSSECGRISSWYTWSWYPRIEILHKVKNYVSSECGGFDHDIWSWYLVSDPDTGYRMLILGIRSWYGVSGWNSSQLWRIFFLHNCEEFFFFRKWRIVNPPFKPLPL